MQVLANQKFPWFRNLLRQMPGFGNGLECFPERLSLTCRSLEPRLSLVIPERKKKGETAVGGYVDVSRATLDLPRATNGEV